MDIVSSLSSGFYCTVSSSCVMCASSCSIENSSYLGFSAYKPIYWQCNYVVYIQIYVEFCDFRHFHSHNDYCTERWHFLQFQTLCERLILSPFCNQMTAEEKSKR